MNDDKEFFPGRYPHDDGDDFTAAKGKDIAAGLPVEQNGVIAGKKRPSLGVEDYVDGVLKNDKTILARAITLIESHSPHHYEPAREVLKRLLPHSGRSLRIGITGVPGCGKSTLIEALGCYLVEQGHKVAVLAVDPSSTLSRGSIMGDKTRMEKLSRLENCFIRPSPSGGAAGGVSRKSREAILVCEAAGYRVILIETVGIGQNEVTVRSMVDFFLLVSIAGAGDELQGIKRGVIELADALLVNKADGDNKPKALAARDEYAGAIKYLKPASPGWITTVSTCSALTGEGIPGIWELMERFELSMKKSGVFEERRKSQAMDWVFSMVENYLMDHFYNHPGVKDELAVLRDKVLTGTILPSDAADRLLKTYFHLPEI